MLYGPKTDHPGEDLVLGPGCGIKNILTSGQNISIPRYLHFMSGALATKALAPLHQPSGRPSLPAICVSKWNSKLIISNFAGLLSSSMCPAQLCLSPRILVTPPSTTQPIVIPLITGLNSSIDNICRSALYPSIYTRLLVTLWCSTL